MLDLKNKRGIIFGATGFIGQNLSYELSKLGCKLILHGHSIEKLSELDNKIQKIISNLTACPGIIQDSDSSDA